MGSTIYALDFDGVLCDSVGESSRTALLAAKAQWPDLPLPSHPNAAFPEPLLQALTSVRPVIETGYENVLLGRLVTECPTDALDEEFVRPVYDDWAALRDRLMQKWSVSRDELVHVFGHVRDNWIASHPHDWLAANRFFPGVVSALNFSNAVVYIITTKQKRFACQLLQHAGAQLHEDSVYGLGMGSKIDVLKTLVRKHPGCQIAFVEDRYETLEKVSISMLGQPLQLFLATWGYNTEHTRGVADKHPFIELLDLPTFVDKFQ